MNLLSFSTEYSAQDQPLIMFKWNGKHSTEFIDYNQEFRRNIIKYVLETELPYYSVELIRDLFIEEAKWSVEAWCVGEDFTKLGEKLIEYGKKQYLLDFLIGTFSTFDTYCASRMMNLEQFEIEYILEELKFRSKDRTNKDLIDKYKSGIELFESYLKGIAREGLYQLNSNVEVKNIQIIKPNKMKNLLRGIYKKIRRNL